MTRHRPQLDKCISLLGAIGTSLPFYLAACDPPSCCPYPANLHGCQALHFLHPPSLGSPYQLQSQADLPRKQACSSKAHQLALGGLLLVIVSIFALLGLCLSILFTVPPPFLVIIPVQKPSIRQPPHSISFLKN